ncbi:MAG: hypothetical protein R8G66_06445 [Cytophagales bacterium]|nr:hypothetical protein [Cytophagales bacterium]
MSISKSELRQIMKKTLLRTGVILGMMLSFWSCRVDEVDVLPVDEESTSFENIDLNEFYPSDGKMVLGKQLENAYSVENMKIALANLTASGRIEEDIQIETTDLYIRFLPKDSTEVALLETDSTLTLFDHPLDFEIEQVGHWYHDPTIPDHMPTWQYTVVKPDFEFPAVEFEVLADLFLIHEDEAEDAGRMSLSSWEALEDEALKITGNEDLDEDEEGGRTETWCRSGRWNPNGTIKVMEMNGGVETGQQIPLWGVEVQARRHFFWSSGTTNSNGYFRVSRRFRKNVNYRIKWRVANRYKITNPWGFTRHFNRPSNTRTGCAWDITIRDRETLSGGTTRIIHNREAWTEATMAIAARHFHYQAERHGLKTPDWYRNARIRLKFRSGSSNLIQGSFRHNPAFITEQTRIWLMLRNDVRFFVQGNEYTPQIYRTMMHELGHVSHIWKSGVNFQTSYIVDPMVVESFGEAVEYYFTLPYYPAIVRNIPNQRENEYNDGGKGWQYTPFFIDLVDNDNQRSRLPNGGTTNDYADDRVFGYSLSQIQRALDNRTTLRGVQEHLRNNFSNSTENEIERLRAFYENIKNNKR